MSHNIRGRLERLERRQPPSSPGILAVVLAGIHASDGSDVDARAQRLFAQLDPAEQAELARLLADVPDGPVPDPIEDAIRRAGRPGAGASGP
jgi:hypothetical protein